MKIAIFPGAFKPPHSGHFHDVELLLDKVDKIHIIISNKDRDGITAEQSKNIWDLYLTQLPNTVTARIAENPSPIADMLQEIDQESDNEYYVVFGKNDGDNVKTLLNKKYPNVHIYDAGNFGGLSSTEFRKAIRERNIEKIKTFLPKGINEVEFMEKMDLNLHEIKIRPKGIIPIILDRGEEHQYEYKGNNPDIDKLMTNKTLIDAIPLNKNYIVSWNLNNEGEIENLYLLPISNFIEKGRTDWYIGEPDEIRYLNTSSMPVIIIKKSLDEIKIQPNIREPQVGDVWEFDIKNDYQLSGFFKLKYIFDNEYEYEFEDINNPKRYDAPVKYSKDYWNSTIIKNKEAKFIRHENIDEIKIQPNNSLKKGDIWTSNSDEGYKDILILDVYKNDIGIKKIKFKIIGNDEQTITDNIDSFLHYQKRHGYTKIISEIKIRPNYHKPKLGDIYDMNISDHIQDDYKRGRFKITDISGMSEDDSWELTNIDNEPIRWYYVGFTIFENYIKSGQAKFIKNEPLKEELFSKEWWNKVLIQEQVEEIKIQPKKYQIKIGDIFQSPDENDQWSYEIVDIGDNSYVTKNLHTGERYYYPKELIDNNIESGVYKLVKGKNIEENQEPTKKLTENQNKTIKDFLIFAIKQLGISKIPTGLTLSYDNKQVKERSSFAYYSPSDNKIWLYVKNRNLADILRSLAHELVHCKQNEDGRIQQNSGETGSEIENEANSRAGILLRDFGKSNKMIYEIKIHPQPTKLKVGQIYRFKFDEGGDVYWKILKIDEDSIWYINSLSPDSFDEKHPVKGNYYGVIEVLKDSNCKLYIPKKSLDEIKIQPQVKDPKVGDVFYINFDANGKTLYSDSLRGYPKGEYVIPNISGSDENVFRFKYIPYDTTLLWLTKDEIRQLIRNGQLKYIRHEDIIKEIKIQPNQRLKVGDRFSIYDMGHGEEIDDDPNHWFTIEITQVDHEKGMYKDKVIYDDNNVSPHESGWTPISGLLPLTLGIKRINEIKIQPNSKYEPQLGDIIKFGGDLEEWYEGTWKIIGVDSQIHLKGDDEDSQYSFPKFPIAKFRKWISSRKIELIKRDDKVDEIKITPNNQYLKSAQTIINSLDKEIYPENRIVIKDGISMVSIINPYDEESVYITGEIPKQIKYKNKPFVVFQEDNISISSIGFDTIEELINWLNDIDGDNGNEYTNINEKLQEFQLGIEEIFNEIKIKPNMREPQVGDKFIFVDSLNKHNPDYVNNSKEFTISDISEDKLYLDINDNKIKNTTMSRLDFLNLLKNKDIKLI